jgi:hypothetical protein
VTVDKWQKSSFSAEAANCLNVANGDNGTVALRESDDPDVIVTSTLAGLRSFIRGVKTGEFDHLVEGRDI